MKKPQLYNAIEYILLFMVIALTGFEFFFRNTALIYLLFPISAYVFVKKKAPINLKSVGLILLFVAIMAIHSEKYNLSYSFIVTGFVRFTTYYFIAVALGLNFGAKFINIVYLLSCMSLIFYFPALISDSFYNFLISISKNIVPLSLDINSFHKLANTSQTLVLYTISLEQKLRNSGPFWEPGMFGVFISIAFALQVIKTKKLFEKKNIIFIITSVTTLSLSSLIATFLTIIYYDIFIVRNRVYALLFLSILLFAVVPIYNTPYVKGKIEFNIESRNYGYSRYGAAIVHWEQIKESPLVGYGLHAQEDQDRILGTQTVTPNGITNIIRYYGIPFSILFYILLFNYSKTAVLRTDKINSGALLLFLILLIVAFSQDVTTRHFYYLLLFLGLINGARTIYQSSSVASHHKFNKSNRLRESAEPT